jgi:hypothetical protein
MYRAFLFLTALLIASTIMPEATNTPSSNPNRTCLSYYVAVVKKRLQGKLLTRKEAQSLSSLKKWGALVLFLAGASTIGLYSLGNLSRNDETSAPAQPAPSDGLSVEINSDEDSEDKDWSTGEYDPSAEEEAKLQQQCTRFANQPSGEVEVIHLEGPKPLHEGLAECLTARRKRISHRTVRERERQRKRAPAREAFREKGSPEE